MSPTNAPNPNALKTTGIGSLPHATVDAALALAFQCSLPYLPQIPMRNPREFMIAQALGHLHGIRQESGGFVSLDLNVWHAGAHALNQRLDAAFARADADPAAFEAFEPLPDDTACWKPFLFELGERGAREAKVQVAGPLTCQWALRLNDGSPIERHPDITTQVYRVVMARAIAMVRALKARKVAPTIFLDEPGLFGLSTQNARHVLGLQELSLMVRTLRKEGATVGLHCCSNTDWKAVLGLELDWISLDARLSLEPFFQHEAEVERYRKRGGRLAFGVVPTGIASAEIQALDSAALARKFFGRFASPDGPFAPYLKRYPKLLTDALYTPACGLALHSTTDAEAVLRVLGEVAAGRIP